MIDRLLDYMRDNLSWFLLAMGFFVAGYVTAVTALESNPQAFQLVLDQLEGLTELGETVFGSHPIRGIFLILLNNTIASFSIIIFSFLLGLLPLLSLFGNGTLLGVVALLMAEEGISLPVFFILGILPHGILELPAFFVSASLGLKIGYHIVFPLPNQTRLESLKANYREALKMAPVIFFLLAAAAFIEVIVTPIILSTFLAS